MREGEHLPRFPFSPRWGQEIGDGGKQYSLLPRSGGRGRGWGLARCASPFSRVVGAGARRWGIFVTPLAPLPASLDKRNIQVMLLLLVIETKLPRLFYLQRYPIIGWIAGQGW